MSKVFIVSPSAGYVSMFLNRGWELTDNLDDADLVQFTGGADVSPMLYGHEKHKSTFSSYPRDYKEEEIFWKCVKQGVPMAGICRGGQFLHVMNGGEMYQDVDNHAIHGTHRAFDMSGTGVDVTSTHHQMIAINGKMEVLLVAGRAVNKVIYDTVTGKFQEVKEYLDDLTDIESCYYKASKCLCYQPHPEMVDKEHECQEWYFNKIKELFGLE